ncbi:hypothetical protein [Izhakiella capsodis]|nr:hypothetical protein [Izhakiella capsodis]
MGNEENQTSIHLFTALAITAIVAGRWMKDAGAPQRGVLRVPAFMANIFIRASHYWAALGNMAGSLPSGAAIPENTGTSQRAPAFEVDTEAELTREVCDAAVSCSSSIPRLTAFSSNSTASPEAYTRATVQNRPAPATGGNTPLSLPEQAHYLAVDKLRQESGLSDLLYCTDVKTESRQRINEKVVTNAHFNTKCDAIAYPEPLTKETDSLPVHTEMPETQVTSAETSRSGGEALLPLVTGAAVASVTTPYIQALKSKTTIAAGVTLGVGTGCYIYNRLTSGRSDSVIPTLNTEGLDDEQPIISALVSKPLKFRLYTDNTVTDESVMNDIFPHLNISNKIAEIIMDIIKNARLDPGVISHKNDESNGKLNLVKLSLKVRDTLLERINLLDKYPFILSKLELDELKGISEIFEVHLSSQERKLINSHLEKPRSPQELLHKKEINKMQAELFFRNSIFTKIKNPDAIQLINAMLNEIFKNETDIETNFAVSNLNKLIFDKIELIINSAIIMGKEDIQVIFDLQKTLNILGNYDGALSTQQQKDKLKRREEINELFNNKIIPSDSGYVRKFFDKMDKNLFRASIYNPDVGTPNDYTRVATIIIEEITEMLNTVFSKAGPEKISLLNKNSLEYHTLLNLSKGLTENNKLVGSFIHGSITGDDGIKNIHEIAKKIAKENVYVKLLSSVPDEFKTRDLFFSSRLLDKILKFPDAENHSLQIKVLKELSNWDKTFKEKRIEFINAFLSNLTINGYLLNTYAKNTKVLIRVLMNRYTRFQRVLSNEYSKHLINSENNLFKELVNQDLDKISGIDEIHSNAILTIIKDNTNKINNIFDGLKFNETEISHNKINEKLESLLFENYYLNSDLDDRSILLDIVKDHLKNKDSDESFLKPKNKIERTPPITDLEKIEDSKVAAVEYLYDCKNMTTKQALNIYEHVLHASTIESKVLEIYSAFHWFVFYDKNNSNITHQLSKLIEKNLSGTDVKNFSDLEKVWIKILWHNLSPFKITALFRSAELSFLDSKFLDDYHKSYKSVYSLKPRSQCASFKDYANQFVSYRRDDLSTEATKLSNLLLFMSGVSEEELNSKVINKWNLQHLNCRNERLNVVSSSPFINGREDEMSILQTSNGKFIVSYTAEGMFYIKIFKGNKIADLPFIMKLSAQELKNSFIPFYFKPDEVSTSFYPVDNNSDDVVVNISAIGSHLPKLSNGNSIDIDGKFFSVFKIKKQNTEEDLKSNVRTQFNHTLKEVSDKIEYYSDDVFNRGDVALGLIPFALIARKKIDDPGYVISKRDETVEGVFLALSAIAELSRIAEFSSLIGKSMQKFSEVAARETFMSAFRGLIKETPQIAKSGSLLTLRILNPIPFSHNIITGGYSKFKELISMPKAITEDSMITFASDMTIDKMEMTSPVSNKERLPPKGFTPGNKDNLYCLDFFFGRSRINQDIELSSFQSIDQSLNAPHSVPVDIISDVENYLPHMINALTHRGGTLIGRGNSGVSAITTATETSRAEDLLTHVSGLDLVLNKANDVVDAALATDATPASRAMIFDHISSLTGVNDPDLIEEMLQTLKNRNNNMQDLNLNEDNILFYKNDREKYLIAYCNPHDNTRTIFFNLSSSTTETKLTVIHEATHFTGTRDIFYINTAGGSITDMLNHLLSNPSEIPDDYIRAGLEMNDDANIHPWHRNEFIKKLKDPRWRSHFLMSNADSAASLTLQLSEGFEVNSSGNIVKVNRNKRSLQNSRYTEVLLQAGYKFTENRFINGKGQWYI